MNLLILLFLEQPLWSYSDWLMTTYPGLVFGIVERTLSTLGHNGKCSWCEGGEGRGRERGRGGEEKEVGKGRSKDKFKDIFQQP